MWIFFYFKVFHSENFQLCIYTDKCIEILMKYEVRNIKHKLINHSSKISEKILTCPDAKHRHPYRQNAPAGPALSEYGTC